MIKSLARITSTASTRILQHQRSDLFINGEEPHIVDARSKAINFMERGQWDKFCELLLSAEKANERVQRGRNSRRNRKRNGRRNGRRGDDSSESSADSSNEPTHQMPPPQHNLLDLDSDRSTLLHALVTHRAPANAIRALHRTFPSMIGSADASGRTPLHCAVEYASLDVVDSLLELHPHAADVRDCNGRTPLIQACVAMRRLPAAHVEHRSAAEDFAYSVGRDARFRYTTKLIGRLARASPRSVLAEDEEGRTALEYAIDALAPGKTVGLLQTATVMSVLANKNEERKRRLSESRRVRAEVQKQPWKEVWMPQFVAFRTTATADATRKSTSGIRMAAPSA